MAVFEIVINRRWCKGCKICVDYCPKGVLTMDEEGKAAVHDGELCSGCRLCEFRCPDYAITIDEESVGNEKTK